MICRTACQAMGTRFEFVLIGPEDSGRESVPSFLQAVAESLVEEVMRWDHLLSPFRTDSYVNHIFRESMGASIQLAPDVFELVHWCVETGRLSEGTFDITTGSMMRRHGLRKCSPLNANADPCASLAQLRLTPATCTIGAVDGRRIDLDFGAVAKGYVLDRCSVTLREHGIHVALLHGGTSSVVAMGSPPGCDAWMIRVRGNRADITLPLVDSALGVSAPRGRCIQSCRDQSKIGHVMDPRVGKPVTFDRTAAVVASDGRTADAWSTAALVAGERPRGLPNEATCLLEIEHAPWQADGPHAALVSHISGPANESATLREIN